MSLNQQQKSGFQKHFLSSNSQVKNWFCVIIAALFVLFTVLFLSSLRSYQAASGSGPQPVVRAVVLYLVIAAAFFVVRFLYEGLTSYQFFTGTVALLATIILWREGITTVVTYFLKAYPHTDQRIFFASSLLSFGALLFLLFGFYPISTRPLKKSLQQRIRLREASEIDWVRVGDYYPVEVVRMETIPQSLERISGIESADLYSVLNRFLSGCLGRKGRDRLILIGGFGSGKSTALIQTVQKRLNPTLFHQKKIPVYIKLRDWLGDEQIFSEIRIKGKRALSQTEDHMRRLFELVADETKAGSDKDSLFTVFLKLHVKGQLIYVFDGMNEVIQRHGIEAGEKDAVNEQLAKNVSAFLHRFAGENPFVISMCELPNVITEKSVLLSSTEKSWLPDPADRYEVYAVKGIHLDNKQAKKQDNHPWLRRLVPNVALYRLALASIQPEEEKLSKSTGLTKYKLLEQYVERRIAGELVDSNERDRCWDAVRQAIENTSKKHGVTMFLDSAYSGLTPKPDDIKLFRHMCNAQLFYEEQKAESADGKEGVIVYHASHILIFEFFLADYLRQEFKKIDMDATKSHFKDFFFGQNNTGKPLVLELPQVKAVFSMLFTELLSDEEKSESASMFCDEMVKWIADETGESGEQTAVSFLVLLSQICDDIRDVKNDNRDAKNGIPNDNSKWGFKASPDTIESIKTYYGNDWVNNYDKVALLKLLPMKDEYWKQKQQLATKIIKKNNQAQLPLQREIIEYLDGTPKEKTEQAPAEGEEQQLGNKEDYEKDLARYLMYEYPAHLLNMDEDAYKQLSPDFESFYRKRLRSIKNAKKYYIGLSLFFVAQIVTYFIPYFQGISHLPILLIKIIGLFICLCSWTAWEKQKINDEEYYGVALFNYSKYEPVENALKDIFKIEDKTSRIIASDWLKNRPSSVFLLSTLICGFFPGVSQWLFPNLSFGWQAFIQTVFQLSLFSVLFLCSFPLLTDYSYICLQQETKNNIKALSVILKNKAFKFLYKTYVFWSVLSAFLIVPFFLHILKLPTNSLEWPAVAGASAVGLAVYGYLLWKVKEDGKEKEKTDRESQRAIIESIKKKDNEKESDKTDRLPPVIHDSFVKMSCKSQLMLLRKIQNKKIEIDQSVKNGLARQLLEDAHSAQVVNAVLELIRLDLIR